MSVPQQTDETDASDGSGEDGDAEQSGKALPDPLKKRDNPTTRILYRKWCRLNAQNEHWMLCIVGEEGSGKSFTALKIALMVDPDFGAENVFFRPVEILQQLRDDEYKPGDVFVLDEAGVGLGKRSWQEKGQRKLNQALQLVRDHNIGIIFTLPRLGELDSQAKGRLQNVFEIVKKEDGEFVQGPWWTSSVDRMDMSSGGKGVWWEKPTVQGRQIGAVSFSPPPQEIVDEYVPEKREFQKEFYDETIDEQTEDEEEEQKSIADYVQQLKEEGGVAPYLSWHGGHNKWNISKGKLREAFDLSVRDSKRMKDRLVEDPKIDIQEAGEKRSNSHAHGSEGDKQ